MTDSRIQTRARLASALDEVTEIELLPIEAVREALEEQGIDPTASIRLAKKFSRGRALDPSVGLLQRIERSETIDAEIAALERADIDEIKAALPAEADRSRYPEVESTVAVALSTRPKRRLSTLGVGGSLIGIAASVLLFVTVRPDRLEQAEAPLPAIDAGTPVTTDAEPADELPAEVAPRSESLTQSLVAERPKPEKAVSTPSTRSDRSVVGEADLADAEGAASVAEADRPSAQSPSNEERRPLAQSLERAPVERATVDPGSRAKMSKSEPLQEPPRPEPRPALAEAKDSGNTALASRPSPAPTVQQAETPENPPIPEPRPVTERAVAAETAVQGAEPSPLSAARVEFLPSQVRGAELDLLLPIIRDIRAILLVDEARASEPLRSLAERLPDGQLAAKIGEAKVRAAPDEVIVLVAFQRDGVIVEAALVETRNIPPPPDLSAQALGVTAFAAGEAPASTVPEASFKLIELSAGN